ncbi:MAG: hypothetical protein R3E75_10635 [Steroidobacteraceae bacterium]
MQATLQGIEWQRRPGDVDHHDHGEDLAHDGLRDVDDVDLGVGEDVRHRGDDADAVAAQHGDDDA